MKKIFAGAFSSICLAGTAVFSASAATVDLPDAFSDLSGIIEIALKIIEFISKVISFFS